jgi:hypothetical protein
MAEEQAPERQEVNPAHEEMARVNLKEMTL